MFDATTTSPARVLEVHGLRETLRALPDFHQKELALLQAEVGDVANREALAHRIADQLLAQYPDSSAPKNELVQSVLVKLDDLQDDLQMEQEELLRKAEVFNRIEQDPVKKSILSKALDTVKKGWSFSWKHKWKILAVIAVIATGVAGWYYWGQLNGFGLGGSAIGEGASGVAGGVAEGVSGTTEGLGAVGVTGEAIPSAESAAQILRTLRVPETSAHVLQNVQLTENGVLYAGQTYTPEAFAEFAKTFAGETKRVLVTGDKGALLTVGGLQDAVKALEGAGISYRFEPSFEAGPLTRNFDLLYKPISEGMPYLNDGDILFSK